MLIFETTSISFIPRFEDGFSKRGRYDACRDKTTVKDGVRTENKKVILGIVDFFNQGRLS